MSLKSLLNKLLEIECVTPEETEREAVKYVPVSDGYTNSYQKRWEDKSYLETVARLSQNSCLTSELINTLSQMRGHADTAKTPEELAGVNKCIAEVKRLLSISQRAKDAMLYMKTLKENAEANDAPSR